jgi:hypothetical protein
MEPKRIIPSSSRGRRSRARASFLGLSTISVVIFSLVLQLHSVNAVKLQGGSALALAGKGCVVLAMDQRVGTR